MSRPKVIVHQIASVDGRLTLAPDILLLYGDERWQAVAGSSDSVYRKLIDLHRPGAILEGSGSFMIEGTAPEPLPPVEGNRADLYLDHLPETVINRPGARGWFTVVDGRGRVRWMYKEFPGEEWEGWRLMVLVNRDTPPEYLAYLQREQIPYLVAGQGRVDLGEAMEKLIDLLNVTCVVSTAGGMLNGALLRAGLVQEVEIDFFPAIIGGKDTPSLFDSSPLKPGELPARLKLLSAEVRANGQVSLRYEVLLESNR